MTKMSKFNSADVYQSSPDTGSHFSSCVFLRNSLIFYQNEPGGGVHGALRVSHQPRRVPAPHAAAAWHRHLLHGVVLRVRGDEHQVVARPVQGAAAVAGGGLLLGLRRAVLAAVGRHLRVMSPPPPSSL